MSDSEELTKLVDAIYKNILDKFNPSARQLISAGKTYLKALHGASAASKLYVDAIIRLARNAQQATWGGAADIGTALMQMVDVYKEIQSQQINLLKAFYVDLLVPLETNLEKDTKVVQGEQKRFMQQHKMKQESYLKAAGMVKKLRKKNRSSKTSASIDKELKQMQTLEEEKSKLETFCEESLRNAVTQERRRYGFVLERQCSLTKHYIAYHSKGQKLYLHHINNWQRISKTRETIPEVIENMFPSCTEREEGHYSVPGGDLEDRLSNSSLRKTKSMDSSCLDLRSLHETPVLAPLTRAKSDFNLASSHQSLSADKNFSEGSFQHFSLESGADWWCCVGDAPNRSRSVATADEPPKRQLVRALYSYLSSGDHQLSFHEGDAICLIGERNKGWQYGENMRNHRCGWFPIAYTEPIPLEEQENFLDSPAHHHRFHSISIDFSSVTGHVTTPVSHSSQQYNAFSSPRSAGRRPHSMFVDCALSRTSSISKGSEKSGSSSGQDESRGRSPPPPPPPLPSTLSSPMPTTPEMTPRKVRRSFTSPVPLLVASLQPKRSIGATGSTSLHSSNDSGFGNEPTVMPPPPPQPEIDYSNEDQPRENVFASVKLRKTVTNDRSAPFLS